MHFTIISCSMNARTEFREKKKREKKRVRYQFPNGTIDMAVKPMKQKKFTKHIFGIFPKWYINVNDGDGRDNWKMIM